MAHQDELEAQLAHGPARLKPCTGGYLVTGTMDTKVSRKRKAELRRSATDLLVVERGKEWLLGGND